MSSDESETEIEDDSVLSKLVATEEFLTSGRPFGLYKENLRAFLHSVHKAAHLPVNLHSGIQAKRTEGGELFDLDYDISFARGFNSAIQDICKTVIEHIAGCQLSWWPLSCPEAELEVGYIRVYSMPFVSSKLHSKLKQSLTNIFSYSEAGAFMTIFRHLAESLFADLSNARAVAPKSNWDFLNREAIFLHNTTLMRLLLSYFDSRANTGTTERGMSGGQRYLTTGDVYAETYRHVWIARADPLSCRTYI